MKLASCECEGDSTDLSYHQTYKAVETFSITSIRPPSDTPGSEDTTGRIELGERTTDEYLDVDERWLSCGTCGAVSYIYTDSWEID